MPTLAESLVGNAQAGAQGPARSVGDAVNAYHIASTAEHARQELEMQKQDQDRNKAQWFAQTIDHINRQTGPAQKVMMDALGPQIKQVYPNFDEQSLELMKKDPQFAQKLNQVFTNIVSHPGQVDWGAVNDKLNQTAPELIKMVDTAVQADANRQAKLAMAQAMGQKNGVFQQKNAMAANQQYGQTLRPIEDTITSANRVSAIIDKIQNGELKSTPTLTTDLSMALAGMLNKGSAATVSGTEHAGEALQSFAGNAAQKYGFVAGQPMNTVTPAQLQQLKADVLALKNEYSTARQNVFHSWVSGPGISDFAPQLQQRYNSFNENAAATQAPVATHLGAPKPKYSPEQLAHLSDKQIQELHQQEHPEQYPQEEAGGN